MMSGDGVWCQCHPILAAFIGDYPKQALVTCTYNRRCPKCMSPPDKLGDYSRFPPHTYHDAINTYLLADGDILKFHAACHQEGLKYIFHLFLESLPLSNVFVSITPDICYITVGTFTQCGLSRHQDTE